MAQVNAYDGPTGGAPPVLPLFGVGNATPVIPKMYWDIYDDEQRIKKLWECFGQIADLYNGMVEQVNTNTANNEEIEDIISQIQNGEYVDGYIDMLASYIDNNLQQFVARLAQYVWPGFVWDGNCWRYELLVPEQWDFLKFSWVWVPEDYSYHINLQWGDFSSQMQSVDYSDLEQRIAAIESALADEKKNLSSLQNSINYSIGLSEVMG